MVAEYRSSSTSPANARALVQDSTFLFALSRVSPAKPGPIKCASVLEVRFSQETKHECRAEHRQERQGNDHRHDDNEAFHRFPPSYSQNLVLADTVAAPRGPTSPSPLGP